MNISIRNNDKLSELADKTGKPVSEIVEEILAIYLDEGRRADFVLAELEDVFDQLKEKYGIKN